MSTGLRKRPTVDPSVVAKRLADAQDWVQEAGQPTPVTVAPAIPAVVQKPRQPKAGKAEHAVYPWAEANDRLVTVYNLRLRESLRLKLKFLSENEPNSSMHSIAIEAVEKEVAARLRKYEKAPPKRAG